MSAYHEVYVGAGLMRDTAALLVSQVLSIPLLPAEQDYRGAAGDAGLSFDIEAK